MAYSGIIKNNDEEIVNPITIGENVFVTKDKTLTEALSELDAKMTRLKGDLKDKRPIEIQNESVIIIKPVFIDGVNNLGNMYRNCKPVVENE